MCRLLICSALFATSICNVFAKAEDYAKPDLLIEPAALAKLLNEVGGNVQILDARAKSDYAKGHLAGAHLVDDNAWHKAFDETRVMGDQQKAMARWESILGEMALTPDRRTIVVGDDWTRTARVWFILSYLGYDKVSILNGPMSNWDATLRPLVTIAPATKPLDIKLTPKPELLVSKEMLKGSIGSCVILDARTPGEHSGKDTKGVKRPGKVPTSTNIPWTEFIDSKTKRMKSAGELKAILKSAGIDPAKPVVSHCLGGGRSSVTTFVLHLLGSDKSANYFGSFKEWSSDPTTPIEKPIK